MGTAGDKRAVRGSAITLIVLILGGMTLLGGLGGRVAVESLWARIVLRSRELVGRGGERRVPRLESPLATDVDANWGFYRRAIEAASDGRSGREVLELLEKGARCAFRRMRWYDGFDRATFDVLAASDMIERLQTEIEAEADARTRLLGLSVLAGFGFDLFHAGPPICDGLGRHVVGRFIEEIGNVPREALPSDDWQRLATRLAAIELGLPTLDDEIDDWLLAVHVDGLALGDVDGRDFGEAVVRALNRPFVARGVTRAIEAADVLRRTPAMTWGDAVVEVRRAEGVLKQSSSLDFLEPLFLPDSVLYVPENRRTMVARLRLARLRAHYFATGDLLEFDDPLGEGPLVVDVERGFAESEGSLRVSLQ